MKLAITFVLLAIPLCCLAGSGCWLAEHVISMTIDPEVAEDLYLQHLQKYISNDGILDSLGELKGCFLDQSNKTLEYVAEMMDLIYNSFWCKNY